MKCSSCTTENQDSAKFCQECGAPFVKNCKSCNEVLVPGAKFCTNCGTPTQQQTVAPEALPAATPIAESPIPETNTEHGAERRRLTVLFSDLVGSTTISEQLDAEDYRELIAYYRSTVAEIVESHNGKLANFVGDGIVAYFGYPVAEEGTAYAAALCALEIVEKMPTIGNHFKNLKVRIEARVGMDTGSVVVGETGSGGHIEHVSLFGEAPNIAARIQSYAEAGEVIASESTHRLIKTQLSFEPLDSQKLKGVSEPIALFLIRPPGANQTVNNNKLVQADTAMIGRTAEIALVETRW